MAHPIHSLDGVAARVARAPMAPVINTSTATSQAGSQTQTSSAPSFTAVFAQMAASAAAAGTTVASIAPSPAGAAQPAASLTATAPAQATPATATASTAAADDPAGPLFGPDPWLTDPTGTGPDGVITHYNPVYFATQQTAQTVAQMLGGTVVQSVQITTAPGSPFQQDQPNYMVQLPNGGLVNPGFIADIYSHGWNQTFIDQQVANEVAGAQPALNS